MAAPSKKRSVNVASKNTDAEGHTELLEDHVNVDFQAFPPTRADFYGIKSLLQQIFLKARVDVGELTDAIISQDHIGNVLKADEPESDGDDEDDESDNDTVFAVASIVGLTKTHRKELSVVEELVDFVKEKCSEDVGGVAMCDVLTNAASRVGWLVCERFLNIPPQAATPMLDSLLSDIDKAARKDALYEFDWYLLIAKGYQASGSKLSHFFYMDAECNVFHQHAEHEVKYSVASEHDTIAAEGCWDDDSGEMEAFRSLMLLSRKSFLDAVDEIKRTFSST